MEENKNTHKQCNVCGREIAEDWNYCNYCGVRLKMKYGDLKPDVQVFLLIEDLNMALSNLDVVCEAVTGKEREYQLADAFSFARRGVNECINHLTDSVHRLIDDIRTCESKSNVKAVKNKVD